MNGPDSHERGPRTPEGSRSDRRQTEVDLSHVTDLKRELMSAMRYGGTYGDQIRHGDVFLQCNDRPQYWDLFYDPPDGPPKWLDMVNLRAFYSAGQVAAIVKKAEQWGENAGEDADMPLDEFQAGRGFQ